VELNGREEKLAPRDSDGGRHGADSITYEMTTDADGKPEAHVSYGRRFGFHMQFREFGTSTQRATPFLRPAANKKRSL
jgi:HK97 gp10 family phage protein